MLVGLFFFLAVAVRVASGMTVDVYLEAKQKKCYIEDLTSNTLVFIEAKPYYGAPILFTVFDNTTEVFHDEDKPRFMTSFSTRSNECKICLHSMSLHRSLVALDIRHGTEARDYSNIAKKQHLTPFVVALNKLESDIREYHSALHYMSKSSRLKPNKLFVRVLCFSLLNIIGITIAAIFQLRYFSQFLKQRKII